MLRSSGTLTELIANVRVHVGIILAERWDSAGSTFVYAEQIVFCRRSVMLCMILLKKSCGYCITGGPYM